MCFGRLEERKKRVRASGERGVMERGQVLDEFRRVREGFKNIVDEGETSLVECQPRAHRV